MNEKNKTRVGIGGTGEQNSLEKTEENTLIKNL
jgi:hypothetical protein